MRTFASPNLCLATKAIRSSILTTQMGFSISLGIALLTVTVLLQQPLIGQAVRNKATKQSQPAAAAATPASDTFTISVDQPYCDTTLPYSYSSTPSKVSLTVYPKDPSWAKTLTNMKMWPQAGVDVTFTSPPPSPLPNGGRDDGPVQQGGALVLNDSGGPLFGDSSLKDASTLFSTDTFDVQRLLVRTLFGPNPLQINCLTNYQTSEPQAGQPVPVGSGAGYPLSLNDPKSPQYYLIDIVRWQDAKGPSTSPGGGGAFFQAATDDWYLLDYSDASDRPQDISKWFRRVTPAFAPDTLRILGSKKVMFLAIHLAPQKKDASGSEQAWFDDTSISYSIKATKYEPVQQVDLDSLIQIALSNTPVGEPAAAAGALVVRRPTRVTDVKPYSFQGLYAAGLLTNLQELPVSLSSTWTATFSSSTSSDGSSVAYNPGLKSPTAKGAATATTPTGICNVSVDATDKTHQASCSGPASTVKNEGRSWWDVSVVAPLSSYSDVTYQASTTMGSPNTLTTSKSISRTNAYGVFDFFLYPEDLVDPPYIGLPHLVVGLPFAGSPLDKPYFAVGETFNIPKLTGKLAQKLSEDSVLSSLASGKLPLSIRPTFGWVYNKVFPTPGSSNSYRSLKPQFGVELSIQGLVKTLSKSSSSASTVGSQTKTTTQSKTTSTP